MNWESNIWDRVLTQLGDSAQEVADESYIIGWIRDNFPFPKVGSTVEWTGVPQARTIGLPPNDSVALVEAFDEMVIHVGAKDDDVTYVLWHSGHIPALEMPLWACRNTLGLLSQIPGQEMHIASPAAGWYIEWDPFFNELHGSRVA